MRFTYFFIMLLTSSILTAVFVSNLSKIINTSSELQNPSNVHGGNSNLKSFSDLKISDSPYNLFWFLQISDLHISNYHDEGRINNLRQFCDSTVAVIEPSLVLASGDLTDAKEENNIGSRQILNEWKHYKQVLSQCKTLQTVKWLDIRGNHDNFDVPGRNSSRNLYLTYSQSGSVGHSFSHTVTTSEGRKYTFIGLDACPEQGLKRPFNFVGLLKKNEISIIRDIIARHHDSDYFIWFGHYPTSCILSQYDHVRKVIGEDPRSLVYLCGHLHTLGGLVTDMYTLQQQGFLELELADWKDNRMYRLLAIDHGLLSFVDVKFEDWPVILITNPKKPLYIYNREPVKNIHSSTHIRVLVFSPGKVTDVGVSIDSGEWIPMNHVGGPLFTLQWNPSIYTSSLHTIKVSASDNLGNEKVIKQEFSLDGTQYSYSLLARICLMTNISSVSQVMFGVGVMSCTLPLCLLRYARRRLILSNRGYKDLEICEWSGAKFIKNWIRRVWILSNIDRLFYPIIIYPLYITVGPWFVGELMREHTGIIFVWGTFINNSYLPGAFTYTFAFKQLVLFHGPFILLSSYYLDQRLRCERGVCMKQILNICMCLLVMSQVYLLYYFWLAYGTLAIVLGPFRVYPLLLFIYTFHQTRNIPLIYVRNAGYPWLRES